MLLNKGSFEKTNSSTISVRCLCLYVFVFGLFFEIWLVNFDLALNRSWRTCFKILQISWNEVQCKYWDVRIIDCWDLFWVAHHVYSAACVPSGQEQYLWQAVVQLELGVRRSPANYQFKLLLMRLYAEMGTRHSCLSLSVCPSLSLSLCVRHVQPVL